jgi:signal transduction histidine kinase
LAWLASPGVFGILVILMIIFTLCIIGIGLRIDDRGKQRQKDAFETFLAEPKLENEKELLLVNPASSQEMIRSLGQRMREMEGLIAEQMNKTVEYEEFIEAWVHEIKTPLSLAMLILGNRRDEMSPLVYQRFEHVRHTINADVERILYYARLQSAHVDYRFETVDLSECCNEVLEEFSSLMEEKGVSLYLDLHPVNVITDCKTLQFILTQILSNSLKYSGKHQGQISVESGYLKKADRHYLQISDNGIGVPKEDLPFIFDKGFTGDHPDRKKATGMGLYLVKKYCDMLKIEIQAESVYKEGFIIRLLFPVVDKSIIK